MKEERMMTIPAKTWCKAVDDREQAKTELRSMKSLYALSQARCLSLELEITRLTRWGDVGYMKAQKNKEECERLLREWD